MKETNILRSCTVKNHVCLLQLTLFTCLYIQVDMLSLLCHVKEGLADQI